MVQYGENLDAFAVHKLATIGFVQSFGPNRDHFFYRRDMSPESLRHLVEAFVEQMEASQSEMVRLLPRSILEGFSKYCDLTKSREFDNFTPETKDTARDKLKLLKEILMLPIYSWVKGQQYYKSIFSNQSTFFI